MLLPALPPEKGVTERGKDAFPAVTVDRSRGDIWMSISSVPITTRVLCVHFWVRKAQVKKKSPPLQPVCNWKYPPDSLCSSLRLLVPLVTRWQQAGICLVKMDAGSSIEKHIVWDCHYLHFWLGRYPVGPIWHRHLALRYPHGGISLWIWDEEEEAADFQRTPLDHGKTRSASLFQADLFPQDPWNGRVSTKGNTWWGGVALWTPGLELVRLSGVRALTLWGVSEQEIALNAGGRCKAKAGVVVGNKW